MKKKIIILSLTTITLIFGGLILKKTVFAHKKELEPTTGVYVVPTLLDELTPDSAWCGTFQLVWNDMKNEVVKQDIIFNPQNEMANNLNKETFTENMLSNSYYYKAYGLKTLELKKQIEKGIKAKFNETSDILDSFDWSKSALDDPNNPIVRRYFFYTMLYREFKFLKTFAKLKNDTFGNYQNVKYFGITNTTKEDVGTSIEVLFYNTKDDFALLINTKSNDEVIFYKNPQGTNFQEIYENMLINAQKYEGSKSFSKTDLFKAPYISLNLKREYQELENKTFTTSDGEGEIYKAIQTIKFTLDEKGGRVKSEAGLDMKNTALSTSVSRNFSVDNTFALFLREKNRTYPYYASLISDITKFQ